jgi:glycosyltransferase involved in cell wall biosynthesis
MTMAQVKERFVMSQTAVNALLAYGIKSHLLPLGVANPKQWLPPSPEERAMVRQALDLDEKTTFILTVADNHERKNLDAAAKIVSKVAVKIIVRDKAGLVTKTEERHKVRWGLVTRVDFAMGWDIDDLLMRNGIFEISAAHPRGLSQAELRNLFVAADVFLLSSKAEGLAVPVLEAFAMRVPVVATRFAAMAEHLAGGRGFGIEPAFICGDPFGNGERAHIGVEEAARAVVSLIETGKDDKMMDRAAAYVGQRSWGEAGTILANTIKGHLTHGKEKKKKQPITSPDFEIIRS